MNEISIIEKQLPDNLEDLTKFALIGREKLNAVKAEIRAIDKVGLAKEVHEQKLQEAQEIAEAVLDAEVKIGELTAKFEKAKGGQPFHSSTIDNTVESRPQTKTEALKEIGIPQHTAERFERLANHPEKVKQAKEEARAEGKIVTRQDVFEKISADIETRKQKEARELREAKRRAEEFEGAKISSIDSVKQNKEDRKQIYQEFENDFENMIDRVRQFASMAENGQLEKMVGMAEKREQSKLADSLMDLYRMVLKIQKKVSEVMDEK